MFDTFRSRLINAPIIVLVEEYFSLR